MSAARRRHVLIVEDDPSMRETLAEALEDMGVQVDVAEDGLAGLARLRQGPVPGAVLLDIRMPRLDGEGFLKQLRADPALCELPVITMSGLDEPTTLPVEARLCKPFDFDELARILASLCDG